MKQRVRRTLQALKAVKINALDPFDWLREQEHASREATRKLQTGEICPYVSSDVHDRITGAYRRNHQGGQRRDR